MIAGRASEAYVLESYETTARPLTPEDIAALHELTVSVGWPHRPRDLAFLIEVGDGFVACDEIGRAVGSAMYFPMGADFATIGMMMTTPRLQFQGAGRWLLHKVLERCAGRDLRLDATRQSYRLHESAGFRPVRTIHQHQGIARGVSLPPVPPGASLREASPEDLDAIAALDLAAFGADRRSILGIIMQGCEGVILERDGAPIGFALCREFGRGHVIGPVVAPDEASAISVIAPLVARRIGQFVRLDTGQESTVLNAYLAGAGLRHCNTVTAMIFGRDRTGRDPSVFALMSHTLG
jgi:GNAT superfamily N-acetyltransferase